MKKVSLIPMLFLMTLSSCEIIIEFDDSSYPIFSEKESTSEIKEESISELLSEKESESNSNSLSESESINESESTSSEEIKTYDYSTLYDGYYSSLSSWSDGVDLKNKLYAIIRNGYTPLKYVGNWTSNENADESLDDLESVNQVYSKNSILKADNVGKTTYGWNREHAFAASLMCGKPTGSAVETKGRATDFHNLFASYCSGNTSRGNKNFGIASPSNEGYTEVKTNGADYKYDSTYFEPSNEDKGRLSRAIFYMATMYKDYEDGMGGLTIVEENVEYDSNNCKYAIGSLSTLINWSNTYAVDRQEMKHNISVYEDYVGSEKQGNRNPYVDIPGLVDYVYGSKKDEAGSLSLLEPSCNYIDIESDSYNNVAIQEAKRTYKVGETFTKNDYTLIGIKKSFEKYSLSIQDNTSSYTFKKEDIGTKIMTIATNDNSIKYPVTVIFSLVKPEGVYKMADFSQITSLYKDDSDAIPSSGGYTYTKTYNLDDMSFTIYGFSNNNKKWDMIKCGNKNKADTAYISTSKIDKKINKIDITFSAVSSDAVNNTIATLYISPSSSFEVATKISFSLRSNSTISIPIDDDKQIENGYYKIEFAMPLLTNGAIAITNIKYYGE